MKKIVIMCLFSISSFAMQVFDITNEEYQEYKKNPDTTIENLKNKYLYKKEVEVVKEKAIVETEMKNENKIQNQQVIKKEKLEKKPIKKKSKQLIVQKEIADKKLQKSNKKDINEAKKLKKETKIAKKVSEKAHFKEKKVLLDKNKVIEKLHYKQLMDEKNTKILVDSISHHLTDSAVDIDSSEIQTVLDGIKKKRFTKFESNLYLNQLKNYMKE